MQLLFEQQRVRAQRDELLPGDQAFDDLANLAVNERLAARNGDHGRATLIGSLEAFLDREASIENRIGIVDFPATRAGEVAAEQRLQHQNQRIAPAPQKLLLEDIGANAQFLEKRDPHSTSVFRQGDTYSMLNPYRWPEYPPSGA